MAEDPPNPPSKVRAPTFRRPRTRTGETAHESPVESSKRRRAGSSLKRLHKPITRAPKKAPAIYGGSYRASLGSLELTRGFLNVPGSTTPRTSVSHLQLEPLLAGVDENIESYGLHEFRDGLFDATFVRPANIGVNDKSDSESSSEVRWTGVPLLRQVKRFRQVLTEIATTRDGVRLFKSFLGFWTCYILCLIPATQEWLGPYNYLIVVSAIINHPGRSIGSQLDGAFFTCLGSIVGLLWGTLAVWLSSSSSASQGGFGAVVSPLFVIFTLLLGWLRCVFGRVYQAVMAAGIAFFYMTLSENYTDPAAISSILARRLALFMVPWALGQALCLVVCLFFFPSAGNRPLVLALHGSLEVIRQGLVLPRPDSSGLNRDLAFHFVRVSQAVRDFALDLTFSPFSGSDCIELRNRLQGVIRALLALRPSSGFFQNVDEKQSPFNGWPEVEDPSACVHRVLAAPTWKMVELCQTSIDIVDHLTMSIAGFAKSFHLRSFTGDEIKATIQALEEARKAFDDAEASLQHEPAMKSVDARHAAIVEQFRFMHPIRQATDKVLDLIVEASAIQDRKPRWKLQLPTYPWSKAFFRMNPNVRHDRGGLTAAYYFGSKRQLEKTLSEMQNRSWTPLERYTSKEQREMRDVKDSKQSPQSGKKQRSKAKVIFRRILHAIWLLSHRLQDFEARFALKSTIVCTLLSLPAFLPQSSTWWYTHDCWWVTVTIWIMMHPRVGGNSTDLFIRCLCATLGAVWAGLAYAAGSGNSFVLAAFAFLYGIPMLYRFTLSNHPRSGVIGCLSFTVISLICNNHLGQPSVAYICWTRGAGIVVGIVVAVVVNWILWPFIARHELRKSLAAMMLHSALVYRRILALYIYYEDGAEPTPEDFAKSEMVEGRIREGFVRVRQLIALTRHEIRLRGPFDPAPYAALIDRCEVFFDRLIDVRQATQLIKPELMNRSDNTTHHLFALRRDAVASILMTLYVLAGALRGRRPLPRYLPSAALARQRLIDAMDVMQAEATEKTRADRAAVAKEDGLAGSADGKSVAEETANGKAKEKIGQIEAAVSEGPGNRTWDDVYRYAFSSALTDCVEQVQQLVQLTRGLVGEVGLSMPSEAA